MMDGQKLYHEVNKQSYKHERATIALLRIGRHNDTSALRYYQQSLRITNTTKFLNLSSKKLKLQFGTVIKAFQIQQHPFIKAIFYTHAQQSLGDTLYDNCTGWIVSYYWSCSTVDKEKIF